MNNDKSITIRTPDKYRILDTLLEKKIEILELWTVAKNASIQNDSKTVGQKLKEITELDDSLYGVWYNLGITKLFGTGWYFDKAIELKLDHIDSWKGKMQYHHLAINMPYGDDNLDKFLHIENEMGCYEIISEIESISKFIFPPINSMDDFVSLWVDLFEYSSEENLFSLGLTLLKYSKYGDALVIFELLGYAPNMDEFTKSKEVLCDFFKGIIFRKLLDFKTSLHMFDKLLKKYPNNSRILVQKELTHTEMEENSKSLNFLSDSKKSEEGFEFYKKVFDLSPPSDFYDVNGLYNFNNHEIVKATFDGHIPDLFKK